MDCEYESYVRVWTVKKAEHWKIDAFELWFWRRLLRVPWTTRRSNQSILKEVSPEYSLEGLMLKLKLQYCGYLIWRADSLVKSLVLGGLGAGGGGEDRGWDGWIASLTRWTWVWVNSGSWRWTGRPGVPQSMGSQRVGHNWEAELNWTEGKCVPQRQTIACPSMVQMLILWKLFYSAMFLIGNRNADWWCRHASVYRQANSVLSSRRSIDFPPPLRKKFICFQLHIHPHIPVI